MMHTKSETDETSLPPSSPRSPKRPVYYVQSPSRDSHDGDKSSSNHASPMESPSRPSTSRHSRLSSASRVSGTYGASSASSAVGWRKWRNYNSNNKRATEEREVIYEEDAEGFDYEKREARRCQGLIAVTGFAAVFSLFCLIIWGASRPFKPQISVKSLTVHNYYVGQGSDLTGVPTKLVTMNCSLKMNVYNPATFFGIHVSSWPVNLMYSELAVATGELKRYYQPSKSNRMVSVALQGTKVPLYGAGASLETGENDGVPMRLVFEVRSRGNVVGKLLKSRHTRKISCSLVIDSHSRIPITFKEGSCTYHRH